MAALSGASGAVGPAEEEDAETREVRQLMARLGIGSTPGGSATQAVAAVNSPAGDDSWQPAVLQPLGHGKEDKVIAYLRFGAQRVAGTASGAAAGASVGLGSLGVAATAGPNDGLRLRGEDDLIAKDLSQFNGTAYFIRHREKEPLTGMSSHAWCRPDAGVYAS